MAVAATYLIGVAGGRRAWGRSIVLAGVAVAALLTAIQTYLQQRDQEQIRQIYNWILGSFSVASWSDVRLILPYVVVSAAVLLAHRRMLDVLRVGEEEAGTLGIHPARTRLIVVAAATLGTAAAVSVSGLIGFVGIIVAHTVRLTTGASYRIILPVAMVGGAAFLIGADLIARTAQAPAEIPIGVVTASVGAPFFLFVLVSRRAGRGIGVLMARLGTVIRLAERRGRRGAGAPDAGAMVELDSVSVRFEGRAAVDTVTASVGRGEWVGLIGANGAGKTTLLRALAGLVEHEGRCASDGTPTLRHGPAPAGARCVAYVPQAPGAAGGHDGVRLRVARADTPHRVPRGRVGRRRRPLRTAPRAPRAGRAWRSATSPRCRGGSASGWCWRGPWPRRHRSSSWTSRRARWTWRTGWRPSRSWTSSGASGG